MSTKSTKKQSKVETLVYCGPSLKNGELQQNSIFRGTLPESVKKHMDNHAIRELFVSTSEFQKVTKNIKVQGTLENQLYKKALEYVKGGSNS